tara:strand:+ start:19114 stop:20031 length:918 start_codon:yes stop_codon:yes gene_type:complete
MKILVTGGAGFIGSHLVDTLIQKGHQVTILDNLISGKQEYINPRATFHNLDVNSTQAAEIISSEFDAIVHLAAQVKVPKSFIDPIADLNTNILGGLKLLQSAIKNQVPKFIYISSAAEIGNPQTNPIDEKHPLNPISPYGISKHTFEKYLVLLAKQAQMNYCILRLANVYGPRQDHSGEGGVVSIFASKILNSQACLIYGDGEQTRDFIYVQDVVAAIITALKNTNSQKYNIGTGVETSINQLISLLGAIHGVSVDLKFTSMREGDIEKSYFDITKAKNLLGWEPQFSLQQGLQQTLNYFKNEKT